LNAKAQIELQQARVEKAQAEDKSKRLQEIIDKRVRQEANRLKKEQKQEIKEKAIDIFAKVGAVTCALIAWNLLLTITLLDYEWHIVSTAPQWFINRWSDIVLIADSLEAIFLYFYGLLQPHMHGFLAGVISFLPPIVMCVVVGIVGLMAYDYIKDLWTDTWEHYDHYNKTLLKASTTIAIIIGSIPLATQVAGLNNPINVVSWWLMFSLGLNVTYHAITYRRY